MFVIIGLLTVQAKRFGIHYMEDYFIAMNIACTIKY